MRITGGRVRGRKIYAPKSEKIRVTSDRVRESLFDILPSMEGMLFLDIFAGSGSVGIEALSRESSGVVFIEKEPLHAVELKKNLNLCGFEESSEVIISAVGRGIRVLSGRRRKFDIIFADPPYDRGMAVEIIDLLREADLIARNGVLIVEHSFREDIMADNKFVLTDQRRYGDTVISFLKPDRGKKMKSSAVYPGSFDPITNGHVDIINRGLGIFNKITVLVGYNPNKLTTLFSVEERISMIRDVVGDDSRVEVDSFSGLLVDYVKKSETCCILRGLRAMSDFEYEFQLALINRKLRKNIETVFLMTGAKWFYCNSSIVKEAAALGGSVRDLVPKGVLKRLKEKFPDMKNNNSRI
ncbi:MAG: pantetheine-phosphate adenylyltransferase [Syntrophobacterales bacterium]|nr:pantetheine-phosphate adenylyltransferase [Syntrophobacterales bacterium]